MQDQNVTHQPGIYYVNITGQFLSKSDKGTLFLELQFDPYAKEDATFPEGDASRWPNIQPVGQRSRFYFTEKAAPISIRKLKSLGFALTQPRFELLDQNTPGFVDMIGQQVQMECQHEQYEGKTQVRWDTVYGGPKPPDENDLMNLNALFGSELVSDPAPAQPAATQATAQPGAAPQDEPPAPTEAPPGVA